MGKTLMEADMIRPRQSEEPKKLPSTPYPKRLEELAEAVLFPEAATKVSPNSSTHQTSAGPSPSETSIHSAVQPTVPERSDSLVTDERARSRMAYVETVELSTLERCSSPAEDEALFRARSLKKFSIKYSSTTYGYFNFTECFLGFLVWEELSTEWSQQSWFHQVLVSLLIPTGMIFIVPKLIQLIAFKYFEYSLSLYKLHINTWRLCSVICLWLYACAAGISLGLLNMPYKDDATYYHQSPSSYYGFLSAIVLVMINIKRSLAFLRFFRLPHTPQ